MTWFERLTALDAGFLDMERDRTAHMHVGLVAVYEGPAPGYRELIAFVESRFHRVPRYRQRLRFVPFGQGRPVWVDESQFDIEFHVRHTALPAPGGEEQLKALAARLFAQRLDRDKPLWEMWFCEGLPEGRWAIIAKTHHCMIDGISGVDIATVLMEEEPRAHIDPPVPWTPRPQPTAAQLLADGVVQQVVHPLSTLRGALSAGTDARRTMVEIAGGLPELWGMARMGQAPASSLNLPIGPHRRFEMVKLPLAAVKRIRAALGGTVNDVILAVVAGGLRELLIARGETPPESLRVMIPVSVRTPEERGTLGNRVTAIFCAIPVGEADSARRLRAVSRETKGLKESRQAIGALALTRLGEFTPPTLAAQAARLSAVTRFFNLVVTNVPGPQHPLYLLGRRMLASYPCVPLVRLSSVGIALLSYDGAIGVGLLGDAERARDLPVLARALPAALAELARAADGARG
ncbi:MAG TPA: wax ester/triacylglycerol synthase family O-acyltransferase [Haliangiales bacterium]|nr:wax ester/triacylglycerol synthase family O-acyltransferase [Haliangiales bacterium]